MDAALITWIFLLTFTGSIHRSDAELGPGNWDSCTAGTEPPPTRIDTSARVTALRDLFDSAGPIDAYIIPNEDAHQSEYSSQYDKRRGYISGFQGSAGDPSVGNVPCPRTLQFMTGCPVSNPRCRFVVVTSTKAALWTDGRYFLEAEDTLDCNWILMRQGVEDVPGMTDWLKQELTNGQTVGASPFLIGSSSWNSYVDALSPFNIGMKEVEPDLIDQIWTLNRTAQPNTHLFALPDQFSGRSWQDKMTDMRAAMQNVEADMMVVTSLDETAWLFNLRASDISYNPFFISYAIIEMNRARLYLIDSAAKLTKQMPDDPSSTTVATHLNTDGTTGSCNGKTSLCVEVLEYNASAVLNAVNITAAASKKVLLSYSCNYAIYSQVQQNKTLQQNTPIATTKTNKNDVERQGMKNSHVRDAVALISFMAKLEKEVKAGIKWTELSASDDLETYRRGQNHNRGLSFNSISGSGSNGAIIHYSVSNLTDAPITTSDMYLLDSGGQYLDGTTDVTRTFHFGQPTDYEKECYTRVLMGHIDLFQLHWPRGLYGREIEPFARAPLWKAGLVYRHGTGHGIGMFLSVHEGPGRISGIRSDYARDFMLDEGQFFSDEPGYYETDKFGIRLENIVMVTNSSLKKTFDDIRFLSFEHITFVPYETNLIKYDMLNKDQIEYLNDYHKKCEERIGPVLLGQGQREGYDWMMSRTHPVELPGTISGVPSTCPGTLALFITFLASFLLV